jgi:hypothetical protein
LKIRWLTPITDWPASRDDRVSNGPSPTFTIIDVNRSRRAPPSVTWIRSSVG